METPLFFKNNSHNLFGVLHHPDEQTDTLPPSFSPLRDIGIVFCSPFAEEKLISHRIMLNLARFLTARGLTCLRFDYRGHGDSEGDFVDATIESRISDIHSAVSFLSTQTRLKKIGLLGLRLGATLASLSCTNARINFLILLAPIINSKTYIEQCLRSNLTTQMATYKKILKDRKQLINDLQANIHVNIDGYLLSGLLYRQLEDINLLSAHLRLPPNILLLAILKNKKQGIESALQSFFERIMSTGGSLVVLQKVIEHLHWADTKVNITHAKESQKEIFSFLCKHIS